ncbi:MAG: AMP-binding protein [Ilumatobacteraceae bacterium]
MNLASLAESHPSDRRAIVVPGHTLTWGELSEAARNLRGTLAARGMRQAIGSDCSLTTTWPSSSDTSLLGRGAVAVPLDVRAPAFELQGQLRRVGATLLVVGPGIDLTPADLDGAVEQVLRLDATGVAQEPDVAAPDPDADVDDAIVEVDDDALAVLAFTSGTAGAPQAAMLSHGNLLANLRQAQAAPTSVRADDVVYGVLPLAHVFGFNVVLGGCLATGAALVLADHLDPAGLLRALREEGVTVLPGVPPMWSALAAAPQGVFPDDAFAGVRMAVSGAAALAPEIAVAVHERFGLVVAEAYGLTEASPGVSSAVGLPFNPGSIGKVLPGVEVNLVDATGTPVPLGDSGEIWVRGDNVFRGYWGDDAATARVLTDDGWLRTGDLAVTDADGSLRLVDRAKDLVIVSGFNVFPAEVEAVLAEAPGVRDAAVVGAPDERRGEAVIAYVVPEPGASLDAESLRDWCRQHLARYKVPSTIHVADQIPRSVSGKLLRRELRQR